MKNQEEMNELDHLKVSQSPRSSPAAKKALNPIYLQFSQATTHRRTSVALFLCIQMKTAVLLINNKGAAALDAIHFGFSPFNCATAESHQLQGEELRIDTAQTDSVFSESFGS